MSSKLCQWFQLEKQSIFIIYILVHAAIVEICWSSLVYQVRSYFERRETQSFWPKNLSLIFWASPWLKWFSRSMLEWFKDIVANASVYWWRRFLAAFGIQFFLLFIEINLFSMETQENIVRELITHRSSDFIAFWKSVKIIKLRFVTSLWKQCIAASSIAINSVITMVESSLIRQLSPRPSLAKIIPLPARLFLIDASV